jgi:hypothetical protein
MLCFFELVAHLLFCNLYAFLWHRYNAETGESTYENPLASPWTEAWDENVGVPYWFNEETQESTYDNPFIGVYIYFGYLDILSCRVLSLLISPKV